MMDWDKIGPANSPTPTTPTTTVPVAPAAPGGISALAPNVPANPQTGPKTFNQATQAEVDAMSPLDRLMRGLSGILPNAEGNAEGIDTLGQNLFGRGNGSPLGGIPLFGDIVGAAGNVAHGVLNLNVVKPIEAAAAGVARVPMGWATGADKAFDAIGAATASAYPEVYEQWEKVNAAANADPFYGGNLKADFNMEFAKLLDDQQYESFLGHTPELVMGGEGVGSLGGALSHAIQGFLGVLSNAAQSVLSPTGLFDPHYSPGTTLESLKTRYKDIEAYSLGGAHSDFEQYAVEKNASGEWTDQQTQNWIDKNINTKLGRLEEIATRLEAGMEVSDVEGMAVEAWQTKAWSKAHATDWLISHGQGITRNPIGQIAGSLALDPLLWASGVAGVGSAVGKIGVRIGGMAGAGGARAAKGASLIRKIDVGNQNSAELAALAASSGNAYEKLALTVASVQKNPVLGPVFRGTRGLIDPFAVYKPSTVQRAVTDLLDASALQATGRVYGEGVGEVRAIGREFGMTSETDNAIWSYHRDKANVMVARNASRDTLDRGFGEDMMDGVIDVDSTIEPMVRNASRDANTELVDYMTSVKKVTFTADDEIDLMGRLAVFYGKDTSYWKARIATMSRDTKSLLHAVTYKRASKEFDEALSQVNASNYQGKLPLGRLILTSGETLDDVVAADIIDNIESILKLEAEPQRIASATAEWNAQAMRYPKMDAIGYATGGKEQVERLVKELKRLLAAGGITKRALDDEIDDLGLRPVRDMLDRWTVTTVDPVSGVPTTKRLWNVGFLPEEDAAWGLKRDVNTGRPMVDRDPTIAHVNDVVPGRQMFSDTTRNALGQIIGRRAAEHLNRPVESIEAFINTMSDVVTGQRLVLNMAQRFEASTFDAGIPKSISKEIWEKARDVAGLDHTTIRGLNPTHVWNAVHEFVPRNLVLKDGSTVDIHVVMAHLLDAAEGDVRIMGNTSWLSQRIRNRLRKMGDGSNVSGQLTVTMYNRLRFSFNPTFVLQRVGDPLYYSIFYGFLPVGLAPLKGANAALKVITDNLGRTGLARFFSMDVPEHATNRNFTAGIKSAMQHKGLTDKMVQRVIDAPDTLIANNMTNMLHARLGDTMAGALDNLAVAASKDPELAADMLAAGAVIRNTVEDWHRVYSNAAGHSLSDNEVGLRYLQEMFNSWRHHVVNPDGTLDFSKHIADGERFLPSDIGAIESIRPDDLATTLGYSGSTALRRDVVGHVEKINGEFVLVKGERDIPWLEEQLRTALSANPDYVKRAAAYFSETWDDFWHRLSLGVDQGGLDISAHYAKEAQSVIAREAASRSMDPWEYLSGVMLINIGPEGLDTAMGRFVNFLKGGPADASIGDWGAFFRSHIDPSAQQTLMDEYARTAAQTPPTAATAAAPGPAAAATAYQPRAAVPAPDGMYAHTVAEGGGTFDAATGKEMALTAGYGVEAPGGKVVANTAKDVETAYSEVSKLGSPQIGTWINPEDGMAYVGPSDVLMDRSAAMALARSRGEKAIRDFANNRDIPVVPLSAFEVRRAAGTSAADDAFTEMVPMSVLKRFVTEDRVAFPKSGQGATDLTELTADIKTNGVQEPVVLQYDPVKHALMIDDGNTRFAAAASMDMDSLPVTVVSTGVTPKHHMGLVKIGSGTKVDSILGEKMLPSRVGLEVSPASELGSVPPGLGFVQGQPSAGGTAPADLDAQKFWDTGIIEEMLAKRIKDGPNPNSDVEAALQQVAKLTPNVLKGTAAEGTTRTRIRELAGAIPTNHASPFSRSHALVISLLKNKIVENQSDIFMLAEMQTKRSVLERSINHPLFGLYPASYMWGKVLPETVKFLAKNPYGATYGIANVERSIAIQREYDPDMDKTFGTVDRSASAFLLDYLTPGLPWSDHEARQSALVREVMKGLDMDIGKAWGGALGTVSPQRWVRAVVDAMNEVRGIPGAIGATQASSQASPLMDLVGSGAAAPAGESGIIEEIEGRVQAAALAPILEDSMRRLSSILLQGESPEE